MAPTTTAPISQALVQALRANTALKAGLSGIHEGLAPAGAAYPFLVYSLHYGPQDYAWGSLTQAPGYDIFIFSRDQVEARNLDALVIETLHDAALTVSGQSTLFARRVLDMSLVDVDDEGQKVYQVGGVHEIWTDQTL